jgi:hypothetical protein
VMPWMPLRSSLPMAWLGKNRNFFCQYRKYHLGT